ncbi:MAG TPA: hypothetical protein PLQ65_01180 [Flavihumibacter sp.]|mgnify:CR=1 FL=1|nr:hypothetical protein [Bacteroidota bacterium]HOA38089.1 hypothetical protein [Flavihumibacter sp.]HQD08246.1 hypothetical protein [Flavihumibacter sp.]
MKCLVLLTALLIGLGAQAQSDSLPQNDSLPLAGSYGKRLIDFAVDNLGNIFLVNEAGELKKLNARGDSMAVFNDVKRYGKLYSIDVTNPLKVLLYYRDFGTIVALDRFLNIRNSIDVRRRDIMRSQAVAQSFDNGVWIYDELAGKLKRLDDNGVVISETADFRLLFEDPPTPVQIADADRLVYLYDPAKGLFVLDYFGTVRNRVALLGWQEMQVIGNRVIGRKDHVLESYVPGSLQLAQQVLPASWTDIQKLQVTIDKIYCLRNGILFVYLNKAAEKE